MSLFKSNKKEIPLNQTKEYLEKQQNIDLLLVLAKIQSPDCLCSNDNKNEAGLLMKETLKKLQY